MIAIDPTHTAAHTMKIPLFLLLLVASTAAAASPKVQRNYEAMYNGCLGGYGYTNNGSVSSCAQRVSGIAEAEIDELHNKLLGKFSGDERDREEQKSSQSSWQTYKDNQCRLAGSHVGSPMYETCPMELNIQRVEQLRELLGE